MNFSNEKKCLIAQIKVDKIRSKCKNKGESLMPLLNFVHAKNNLNTLYFLQTQIALKKTEVKKLFIYYKQKLKNLRFYPNSLIVSTFVYFKNIKSM